MRVSNPDKILFPDVGITKGDLVRYYGAIAPVLLPHARGRPVTMHVFHRGIASPGHYVKHAPAHFPASVRRLTVPKRGGEVTHVLVDDASDLQLLANQNCITPHVWTSREEALDRPDRLVVDLDPPDDEDGFARLRGAARLVGDLLRDAGLEPFAMTSGSRGLHVVAPLVPECRFPEVFKLATALAEAAVRARPGDLTTAFSKAEREGRIYVDVLRNRWAQTVPVAYAVRPRPGAPVATPLRWDELGSGRLHARRWTIRNVRRRLARMADPWADLGAAAGSPRDARRRLR